jgi:hypothetical protein
VSAPSASVWRVTTSTTRKARGARARGAGAGFGAGLRGTKTPSAECFLAGVSLGSPSSGRMLAPVPLVAVSRM